jgi:NAD(P)-dependent dehydrogenase (short-subunit alcohol dehydrogenase family)
MTDQKLAIVTGAGGGIGAATARGLHARGFHVLAGVRKHADADKLEQAGIEAVILDITKPGDIARIVERVETDPQGRRLGVLVNNAAVSLSAPAELVPIEAWRENFEVNFFGHVAITTALTPALAAAGESRVINMSSMAAILAGPSFGPYAAAKRAFETYSDMLRRELRRSGIKVIVIQPSSVKTPGWDQSSSITSKFTRAMTPGQHERYDDLIAASYRTTEKWSGNGVEASAAAKVVVNAIAQKKPRPRYRIGNDAKMVTGLLRVLGDRSMDRVLNRMLGLK